MRARHLANLPAVLVGAALGVMAVAAAASAASGLPPTITMRPGEAGPGSRVEILGLDFPAASEVDLLLTTTAGPVPLGTATTGEGGYFRQVVTFPADIAPGYWELRATGPGGAVAVRLFEAAAPDGAGGVEAGTTEGVPGAEPLASSGALIDPNIVVLLVLLLLVVAVGGAATFVWYQTHRRDGEPGMSAGDDPIWSGAAGDPR